MPRPATGTIMERPNAIGGVNRTLRFNANGRRRTVPLGEVSRDEAERRLGHLLADVERGTWAPREPVQATVADVPTFHAFAEQWWLRNEAQLAAKTQEDYRWRLEKHLLPFFGEMLLDAIKFDTVEGYIAAKLAQDKPLSARSVNMTLTLLAAIMETAVERELIHRNPAKGKGRRVRERAPARSYLDAAGQVQALLEAAGELDRKAHPTQRHVERRAILATMVFAGLRIGELCALRWRDVDLAGGWLTVGDSKTGAGRRKVKIRGALRDELAGVRSRVEGEAVYAFPTRDGGRQDTHNIRSRVVKASVGRANANLAEQDLPPLPEGLTPHSLRRTFCSLLYALGEDPGTVMDEMGHTDPGLALRVYRQAMRRDENEKAALQTLVEGGVLAHKGTKQAERPSESAERDVA